MARKQWRTVFDTRTEAMATIGGSTTRPDAIQRWLSEARSNTKRWRWLRYRSFDAEENNLLPVSAGQGM